MITLVKFHLGQHELLGLLNGSFEDVRRDQLVLVARLRSNPCHFQFKLFVLGLIMRHVDTKNKIEI